MDSRRRAARAGRSCRSARGSCDLAVLRTIRDSGYRGPDRHPRPHAGRRRGAAPRQPRRPRLARPPARRQARRPAGRSRRTPVPAGAETSDLKPADGRRPSPRLSPTAPARTATQRGAPRSSPRREFACLSCHKVGDQGGEVGPDLSTVGGLLPPEQIVESVLWPSAGQGGIRRRRHRDATAGPPGLQAAETDDGD